MILGIPKSPTYCFNHILEMCLIVTGIVISCYFFYPGCMTGDSIFSWSHALRYPSPRFYDWHPPLVAYVWYLLNLLPFDFNPRYADLFIAMNILYWVGLILAMRPWIHHKLLWLIFFIYVGFFPPNFAIISQNLKDSLMCAALMAAYGSLLVAERQNSRLAFAFGLVSLFLALGFRHNALFAVFPLAMWAGFIFHQNNAECTWRKKILVGMAVFITLLACSVTTNSLLTKLPSYPVQGIYTYDLVGISALTGHVYLPEFYNDDKKQFMFSIKGADIKGDTTSIENIRLLYSPDTNNDVYWYGKGKGLRILHTKEEMDTLQQAWLYAIIQEPLAYLKIRTDLYSSLIGLTHSGQWRYYCMTDDPTRLKLPDYYLKMQDSFLFKGIMYIGMIILLFAIACMDRNIFPLHLRVIGASALIYLASYFFIGVGSDFRYLYWLITVSLIMVINMTFIVFTRE